MTVAELIKVLQEQDQTLEVCLQDSEEGQCILGGVYLDKVYPIRQTDSEYRFYT